MADQTNRGDLWDRELKLRVEVLEMQREHWRRVNAEPSDNESLQNEWFKGEPQRHAARRREYFFASAMQGLLIANADIPIPRLMERATEIAAAMHKTLGD